jgi:hypothetical protein
MEGHTGGVVLSMGHSANLQRVVTRSSTESELVSIRDVMSYIFWSKNFLETQGFPVTDTILHHPNQSCILLAKNGQQSK